MEKVISTQKIPIKLWLTDIEEGALRQAENLANLPFAFKHIAIMPDSHQGYGMPIGGVLATKGAIIPNAVGTDIGCGMSALRTSLENLTQDTLKDIMSKIRSTVPVGFSHQEVKQHDDVLNLDNYMVRSLGVDSVCYKENGSAHYQLGTLGGGNHFIEIQKGSDGYIWVMIHSGSRNVGYSVAKYYHNVARQLCEDWVSDVPKDLSFFPQGSKWYRRYEAEMKYCVEFALANRKLMMERIKQAFDEFVIGVEFHDFINKPHNYAAMENHFHKNVMVHRKGACRARKGELGMVPGSQGSSSYIVKGKGNADSFTSCSHGAGRKMSRTKARNTLDLSYQISKLNDKGVLHAVRGKHDLDEAPGAYKDIDKVMEQQKDLIKIQIKLQPLAVIKG